jgi:hypothetical protein
MTQHIYRFGEPVMNRWQKRYRRRLMLAGGVLLILAVVVAAVIYDLIGAKNIIRPVSTGPTYESKVADPNVYKNDYFQFSDTAKWEFVAKESTANKFVYISYVAKLPTHMLTVFVNQTPLQNDLAVTRALPAKIVSGNALEVTEISDTCGKLYKPADLKRIRPQAISSTTILCVPDSPQFTVAVGQVGSDYNLILKRANGQTANYIILYRNLSANPEPTTLPRVLRNFQAV